MPYHERSCKERMYIEYNRGFFNGYGAGLIAFPSYHGFMKGSNWG